MCASEIFPDRGVYFSCERCSSCCRHESGFVYLSEEDVNRLCRFCGAPRGEFVALYCRWVPYDGGYALSLKEKSNFDCVFYTADGSGGCSVYDARPVQCAAYPFWQYLIASKDAWEESAAHCPGIRAGLQKRGEFRATETMARVSERHKTNAPILRDG
jgi:Fe-S-cluster containining protein